MNQNKLKEIKMKMKTNIKMRVTPEQSKRVQEICFGNGVCWQASGAVISNMYKSLLYITNTLTFAINQHIFDNKELEEVLVLELDFFSESDFLPTKPSLLLIDRSAPKLSSFFARRWLL